MTTPEITPSTIQCTPQCQWSWISTSGEGSKRDSSLDDRDEDKGGYDCPAEEKDNEEESYDGMQNAALF